MTLNKAFNLSRHYLTRPGWNEYAHIQIQFYAPSRGKVGGVRQYGRVRMHPWVMLRDGDGERRLDSPEADGWIEWEAPADTAERAKDFGWETYKP